MEQLGDLSKNTGTLVMRMGFAKGGPADEIARRYHVTFGVDEIAE